MSAPLADRLQRAWGSRSGLALWLLPISWLVGAVVQARKGLYAAGWLPTYRAPVPVIVVGNVVAGGAGKTPVTMAVIEHLVNAGWSPGVVSRGYGRSTQGLQLAQAGNADPALVGDEPALIAERCQVPVAVAEQRSTAAAALLAQHPHVNVLVCDDGLQHLALARDIEICVWSKTGAGNGWLLPAGPLREPWPRPVDLVVFAGDAHAGDAHAGDAQACDAHAPGAAFASSAAPAFRMQRRLAQHAITASGEALALTSLANPGSAEAPALWALAGTAHPEEFFAMLRSAGLALSGTTALPDHYSFDSWKRTIDKGYRLICTEKDAIKLWPHCPDALAVRLELDLPPPFFHALDALLAALPTQAQRP